MTLDRATSFPEAFQVVGTSDLVTPSLEALIHTLERAAQFLEAHQVVATSDLVTPLLVVWLAKQV